MEINDTNKVLAYDITGSGLFSIVNSHKTRDQF